MRSPDVASRRIVPAVLVVSAAALLAAAAPVSRAAASGSPVADARGEDVRAQLTARHFTVLSSEIAGGIVALPLREGERFAAGAQLAAIACASYESRLALAQAHLQRSERKAQALRLLDQRGATGKVELDLADIDVAAARAEHGLAAIDVARCSIAAPFAGSVAALKVRNHQYVPAGEPIIAILSDRELEVEMLVPSRWLVWLRRDMAFRVHVDELDRAFPASVTRISPDIDPVSQSVKVFGVVTGDFPALLPGMSGLARFGPPEDGAAP